MSKIDGQRGLAVGVDQQDAIARDAEIFLGRKTVFENAEGSGSKHYYVWPTLQGQRVPSLRPEGYSADDQNHQWIGAPLQKSPEPHLNARAHVFPGEVPYILSTPLTTNTFDSDGGTNSSNILAQFDRIDARDGDGKGSVTFNDQANRNTDTNKGGVKDDPELTADARNIALAMREPNPMGIGLVARHHWQLDLRST